MTRKPKLHIRLTIMPWGTVDFYENFTHSRVLLLSTHILNFSLEIFTSFNAYFSLGPYRVITPLQGLEMGRKLKIISKQEFDLLKSWNEKNT